MSSRTEIVKGPLYDYLRPLIGDGLLTSTGYYNTHININNINKLTNNILIIFRIKMAHTPQTHNTSVPFFNTGKLSRNI